MNESASKYSGETMMHLIDLWHWHPEAEDREALAAELRRRGYPVGYVQADQPEGASQEIKVTVSVKGDAADEALRAEIVSHDDQRGEHFTGTLVRTGPKEYSGTMVRAGSDSEETP